MTNNITWVDVEKNYDEILRKIDAFFVDLQGGKYESANGVVLTYRDGQRKFAIETMKAIKNKDILLVEAGVGIGKSFGYLIPLFYTVNGIERFNKIVISTSSIALCEQLKGDVERINRLLNVSLRAEVSKGMNNYACLKRIRLAISSANASHDEVTVKTLNDLKRDIEKYETCDSSNFNISNPLWKRIQVKGGCDRCEFKNRCEYIKTLKRVGTSDIVITNHTQLSNLLRNKGTNLIDGADAIVIDEAHKLEEQMRLSKNMTLNIGTLITRLNEIKDKLDNADNYDAYYELDMLDKMASNVVKALIEFIKKLRKNATITYNKTESAKSDIHDVDKLSINLSNKEVKQALDELIKNIRPFTQIFNKDLPIPGINKSIQYVKDCINVLIDMSKGKESKCIYWVHFIDEYNIEIIFTPKSLDYEFDKLYSQKRPVIMTSGTLTTNGTYDKIKEDLRLTSRMTKEHPSISSPYDYSTNSLVYYDTSISSPTSTNRDAYINDLIRSIKKLIKTTKGRALILFTAKSDMVKVYNAVNEDIGSEYNLILQGNDANKCKEEFINDVNSCLFATGSFWEGIDIKGETLSNLIIARLPFPVQDPIVEYKKQGLTKKDASEEDLNEMLIKLAQGTGRLIRSSEDTGIVCILDSRVEKYLNEIKATLPFVNYTTSLDQVSSFVDDRMTPKRLILQKPKNI